MEFFYLAQPLTFITGILLGWVLVHRYTRRHERLGEASSEEILAELDTAWAPRKSVEVRTQTEYLPFLFESILENVDSGFGPRQSRLLLERIQTEQEVASAIFPVETGGVHSDLDIRWQRDPQDRICITFLADPKIARSLKRHSRVIPGAVFDRGRSSPP